MSDIYIYIHIIHICPCIHVSMYPSPGTVFLNLVHCRSKRSTHGVKPIESNRFKSMNLK